MKLLLLFAAFFRIGLFAVGGGLATLPFLFELADNKTGINTGGWLTRELIGNMLAVAQSSPGAVGANLASYVGLRFSFIPGAYISALALTAPSVIIILMIARALKTFKENAIVKNLFSGFRPAAAGLLSAAGFGAISLSILNTAAPVWHEVIRYKETLLFSALFFLVIKFKKHPIVYIIAGGAAGIILKI
jgi:chromate transporter